MTATPSGPLYGRFIVFNLSEANTSRKRTAMLAPKGVRLWEVRLPPHVRRHDCACVFVLLSESIHVHRALLSRLVGGTTISSNTASLLSGRDFSRVRRSFCILSQSIVWQCVRESQASGVGWLCPRLDPWRWPKGSRSLGTGISVKRKSAHSLYLYVYLKMHDKCDIRRLCFMSKCNEAYVCNFQ